jgi:hypothetical protein
MLSAQLTPSIMLKFACISFPMVGPPLHHASHTDLVISPLFVLIDLADIV